VTTYVELAARALCLAAGKDPDACAKTEKQTEYGGMQGYRETEVCVKREWETYTREAKAVLMAVGLEINPHAESQRGFDGYGRSDDDP
jgi:hypothetical protein